MSPTLAIIVTVLIVLGNAFFVATEFAMVKIRPTRLDQLAGIEKPPVVVPPSTKRAPRRADPPPRQMYVLEVIEGTKRSVEKF